MKNWLKRNKIYAAYALLKGGYLKDKDWFTSFVSEQSGINGEEVPWLTYPAIHFLSQQNLDNLQVLEFGAGSSTVWFGKRNCTVYSIETDKKWYDTVSRQPGVNEKNVFLVNEDRYFEPLKQFTRQKFDVVLIDGKKRGEAIKKSLPYLKETGVVILDNAERPGLKEGIQLLLSSGFKKLDFEGMTPGVAITSMTSIFYRASNCLGI